MGLKEGSIRAPGGHLVVAARAGEQAGGRRYCMYCTVQNIQYLYLYLQMEVASVPPSYPSRPSWARRPFVRTTPQQPCGDSVQPASQDGEDTVPIGDGERAGCSCQSPCPPLSIPPKPPPTL